MNEEILTPEIEVTDKLRVTIEAKIKELKESNPKVRVVYPIIVAGSEGDEKELYIGYFRQPSFQAFSKYLTASQSNQAVAMRTLAHDCFLAGDKELVDDDSLFLFGLMGNLSEIIKMRHSKLVNLSNPGK